MLCNHLIASMIFGVNLLFLGGLHLICDKLIDINWVFWSLMLIKLFTSQLEILPRLEIASNLDASIKLIEEFRGNLVEECQVKSSHIKWIGLDVIVKRRSINMRNKDCDWTPLLISSLHWNKFLRIYQTNYLNLTMNFTVCVANCCKHWFYLIFYIEMFSRNPQDFIMVDLCMLTNTRYLINILFHYKLKKSKVICTPNIIFLQ